MTLKVNVMHIAKRRDSDRPAALLKGVALGALLLSLTARATTPVPSTTTEADPRRDAAVTAIETVLPSVVNIATETVVEHHDFYEQLFRDYYGAPRQERSVSLGSGVIIDEEGYLLTNFHVVSRASRVQVKLWDGREYDAQPLIATPGSDVALLKIKSKPGEKFRPSASQRMMTCCSARPSWPWATPSAWEVLSQKGFSARATAVPPQEANRSRSRIGSRQMPRSTRATAAARW